MEHKFRAWDKENKCMVYQEDMNGHMINKPYWFSLSECEVELLIYDKDYKAYCRINADIMEYTGLKDINGIGIYVGDIVERRFMNLIDGAEFIGVVKKYDGSYYIDNDKEAYPLFHEIDEIEILGNIYENSELLEGDR